MARPTKQQIEAVMEEVESYDLPDGAHWMLIHERLGLEYGDLFPLMERYGMLERESGDG